MCFALRIAGLATSSGFARAIGCPGGAFGLRMLSKTGLALCFLDFCGELFLAILSLHSRCVGTKPMLAPHQRGVKQNVRESRPRPLGGRAGSQPLIVVNYFWGGLGFTATRRLREDSQRVRGFCAAALLKFIDPVGHGIDHVARRFTCGVLSLGCGRSDDLLFTLFNYANCFLLRHCCIFELPVESIRIERISRLSVPKLTG